MAYKSLFSGGQSEEENQEKEKKTGGYKSIFVEEEIVEPTEKKTTIKTIDNPLIPEKKEPTDYLLKNVKAKEKIQKEPLVYSPKYKKEIEEKLAINQSVFSQMKDNTKTLSAPTGSELTDKEEISDALKGYQKKQDIEKVASTFQDIEAVGINVGANLKMQVVDLARMTADYAYKNMTSPVSQLGINPIAVALSIIDSNSYDQTVKGGEAEISNWANERKTNIANDIKPAYDRVYDDKDGLSNWKEYAVTMTSGAVSIVEAIAITALTKNTSLAAAILSTQEAAAIYSESRDAGKSIEQSEITATVAGVATFYLEKFGLDYIFTPKAGKAATTIISNILKTGTVETGQEELQTVVQNLTSIVGYDKAVDWGDDIWQTAVGTFLPSAILGGGTNAIVTNKYISYLEKTYKMTESEATQIANGMSKTVFDIAKSADVMTLDKDLATKPIITDKDGKPLAGQTLEPTEENVIDISTPEKIEEAIYNAEEQPVDRLIKSIKEDVPEVEDKETTKVKDERTIEEPTAVQEADKEINLEELPEEVQEKATADWEDSGYAKKFLVLENKVSDLKKEMKKAGKKRVEVIKGEISDINNEIGKLENEFLEKWTKKETTEPKDKNFNKIVKTGENGKTDLDSLLNFLDNTIKEEDKVTVRMARDAVNNTQSEKRTKELAVKAVEDLGYKDYADFLDYINNEYFEIRLSEGYKESLAKMVSPEKKTEKEKPIKTKSIAQLEKELSKAYKAKEDIVEKNLAEIIIEMEVSEAGEKIGVEKEFNDLTFLSKPSTFPKWVAEHLRSKKLFDAVLSGLSDINNITYPDKNKKRQRELFDIILEELDSRAEIDTSEIRYNIIKKYEDPKTKKRVSKKTTKKTGRSLTRREGLPRQEEKPEVKDILGLDEDVPMFQELDSLEKKIQNIKNIEEYKGFNLLLDEADRLFGELFFPNEVQFNKVRRIRLNGKALGVSRKERVLNLKERYIHIIDVVTKNGKANEFVLYHEIFHKYFELFVSEEERNKALKVVKESILLKGSIKEIAEYYSDEKIAEEWLANDFAKYVGDKKGVKFTGLMKFYNKILNHIRNFVRKEAGVNKIYEDILNKKRPVVTKIEVESAKFQETTTKLPDIQLKRDVTSKDYQGNKIILKEGDVYSVSELPKNKFLLEGKESYTVLKNPFQNIKGQSVIAEGKEFAPELEATEETVLGEENGTKFAEYTLPEGKNYREILVQAPEVKIKTDYKVIDNFFKRIGGEKNLSDMSDIEKTEYQAILKKQDLEIDTKVKNDFYFKPHWGEVPNILFHLRMNDRIYNGKKVSFMEEFQSDLAREGRESGFIPEKQPTLEEYFKEGNIVDSYGGTKDKVIKFYPNGKEGSAMTGWSVDVAEIKRDGTLDSVRNHSTMPDLTIKKGVPYNPLLKNWQVTDIKRALQEAVNTDSEYFAWTTGDQQKARYNLSNELDYAKWKITKSSKDTLIKTIDLKLKKTGSEEYLVIDEKGIVQQSSKLFKEDANNKKLDEVIGKGLADKIMSEESGSLSEEGLNFGGEWANTLYDRQAKNIVEDLTGGKVEYIDLELGVVDNKYTKANISGDDSGKKLITKDLKENLYFYGQSPEYPNGPAKSWVLTSVLENGKFKAVERGFYDNMKGRWLEMEGDKNWKERLRSSEETFDISTTKELQPALKITPEIKAIIKGEAPQFKAITQEYKTQATGSQLLVEAINRITTEEAFAQSQDFAIVRDMKTPIRAVEMIAENPKALGKYVAQTIEFINNPDITTMPHEVGHYWFDTMLTVQQQDGVLEEYKVWFIKNRNGRSKPLSRLSWEESMMQDMAEYYVSNYSGKKNKIQRFWDWFIYQIKQVLRKNDFIAQFTNDVRTKSPNVEKSKKAMVTALEKQDKVPNYTLVNGTYQTQGKLADKTFVLPNETKGQLFRRKVQESNTRLDTAVTFLRKEQGVYIPESQDIFLAKTLLPRRIGGATEKFRNEVMQPLINSMGRDGVEIADLDLYMHSVHAPERNARMNQLRKEENTKRNLTRANPQIYSPVEGLSGMTNEESANVIKTFKEAGTAGKLEKYRKEFSNISKKTVEFQYAEGLLTEEEYKALQTNYDFYVPLSRDMENVAKTWGTGKGVNIKGKENKRARGNAELPILPITAQIFNKMNVAIVRAEKNRVAKSMAKLIIANPNEKLWSVKSEKYIPQYDSFGEVQYLEPLGAMSQKPNEIAFKEDGKQKYMVINDPLLIKALTDENKSRPVPYLFQFTALLSKLATQYNPEFMIRNFSRDISEALINVQGIAENELSKEKAKGINADILKNVPKLFGQIYGYKSGKEINEGKALIEEFVANGGEVGFFWLEEEKSVMKEFEKMQRRAMPKGFKDIAKNKAADFIDFVGNINATVELVTRIATYKALRDRGMSAPKSAEVAGDITVDFNKKGEWGSLISSMYMFFNAAIQGTARMYRGIKSSKKIRLMTGAMFIGGFLNGIISQILGDGDDEDYDKYVPDYKKNTRIIFTTKSGKEITLFFLPYGYGFFWASGRNFSELVTGQRDIIETAKDTTKSFLQSFVPIDVTTGIESVTPSILKPVVEVANNEAWYNAPIAPEQPQYAPNIPEYQRYFSTVSETSKALTKWLSDVTGGDENKSGIIDISPENLDYLFQQYTSGAGSFVGNTSETIYGIATKNINQEKVPFLRSFVSNVKKEIISKSDVYNMIDESGRTNFDQSKKDNFYNQVDWLVKNEILSEDYLENIDKGKELKLKFIKAQYNFKLTDKEALIDAMAAMSDSDSTEFFSVLTEEQINRYLK